MKLAARELPRALGRAGDGLPGLLLFGPDPGRTALVRTEALAALLGPAAEAEMRLERLAAGEARRSPGALGEALRARGFFPGPRAVLVEEAGDGLAEAAAAALAGWQPGDATLVLVAGELRASSALRRLFDGHRAALAVLVRDDPPGAEEIARRLAAAGAPAADRGALAELEALGRSLDAGAFGQLVEKLALFARGQTAVTAADVAACAPLAAEAGLEATLHAVAEGDAPAVGPLLVRLADQGVAPVALAIAAARHFRALYAAAVDPSGPEAGIARCRPPVPWAARERMARQARRLGPERLERALALILETDLALRSAARAPAGAVIERCLIRLARLAAARGG